MAVSVVSATGSSSAALSVLVAASVVAATGSSPTALGVLAGASLAPASSSAETAVASAGSALAAAVFAGAVAGSSAALSATGSVVSGAAAAALGASPLGAVPADSACGLCAPWACSAAALCSGRVPGRCLGGRGRGVHRGVHGLGRRRVGGYGGHCLGHAVAYGFDRARRRVETAHGQRRHCCALGQRLGRLCRELLGCEFDRPASGIHQITLPGVESLVVASPHVPTTRGRACEWVDAVDACASGSRIRGQAADAARRSAWAFPRRAQLPTGVSSC